MTKSKNYYIVFNNEESETVKNSTFDIIDYDMGINSITGTVEKMKILRFIDVDSGEFKLETKYDNVLYFCVLE